MVRKIDEDDTGEEYIWRGIEIEDYEAVWRLERWKLLKKADEDDTGEEYINE